MSAHTAARLSVARRPPAELPLPPAVAGLSGCRVTLARIAPAVAAELDAVIARLKAVEVKVTFGGRFITGKSSLLDAALGERLLPTGDLPETGVSCHVRKGPRRSAALVGPDFREEMACDTADLRNAVTLRGGNDRIDDLSVVRRVDIELPTFPGGPDAVWIDPPGLFDVDAMTERARLAIDSADVVVWVLRSQQFLGESEMDEIANRVALRGWASVVFVENAYLRTGHPDPWAEHLEEVDPVNRDKMRHHAADMGFPTPPSVLSVSAELVLTRGPDVPGGRDLSGLLAECGRADAPRVAASRYQWLHRVLTELTATLTPAHSRLKGENDRTEEANARASSTGHEKQGQLTREVNHAVDDFVSTFESAAGAAGAGVAAEVSAANYLTDSSYDTRLKVKLRLAFTQSAEAMFARLDEKVRRWKGRRLAKSERKSLLEKFTPTYYSVTVANTSAQTGGSALGGAAAGAAAGAVVGSFLPVIGTGIGAVIGGVSGAIAGNKKAAADNRAKDVAATKNDIEVTTGVIAASVTNRRDELLVAVQEAYLLALPAPVEELVDRSEEIELEDTLDRLRRATDVCEKAIDEAITSLSLELS